MTEFRDLNDAARESQKKALELLSDELNRLKKITKTNIDNLRPTVTDTQTYDKLIAAVNTATANNESIAQLKDRLKNLGEGVVKMAKEVAGKL